MVGDKADKIDILLADGIDVLHRPRNRSVPNLSAQTFLSPGLAWSYNSNIKIHSAICAFCTLPKPAKSLHVPLQLFLSLIVGVDRVYASYKTILPALVALFWLNGISGAHASQVGCGVERVAH